MFEDEFEPRLGKIGNRKARRGQKYLSKLVAAISRAGGRLGVQSKFSGSQIGRGAGVGAVLHDRHQNFRARRIVIKSRIVKIGGKGFKAAQAHLRYIQRDGVTREGSPGMLYSASEDHADGRTFMDAGKDDRHQFRFIVAPEDGEHYENLKDVTRRLMKQMEIDLNTKLEWIAVDHFNTGHPHTHVILRGKDDKGKDLIITRDYMNHGMRARASEIVTLDLGERSDFEIEHKLREEVEQERFTSLDHDLLRNADSEGRVQAGLNQGDEYARLRQTLRAARLQKLKQLGMAEEMKPGHWQLPLELEPTLRRMGERGDIIKTMHKAMAREKIERAAIDQIIYDPTDARAKPIIGRLIERGLSDEMEDRHYLIIDGVDGRTHYVGIGKADTLDAIPKDSLVRVTPKDIEPRKSDHTIAEVAAAHDGRYDIHIHMRHDPNCSWEFAQTHVRRLEAMRRSGFAERQPDGTWMIPTDHLEKARAYERNQAQLQPIIIDMLSSISLDKQIGAEAATWLDRELVAEQPTPLRDSGFGQEVTNALAQRQQWLFAQGLAEEQEGNTIYQRNLLAILRRRELTREATQLSKELGLAYSETPIQGRIEGTYCRSLNLISGKFAIIEKGRTFTLVPWRPVLERNLGKAVSGHARGDDISWTIGRGRGRSS